MENKRDENTSIRYGENRPVRKRKTRIDKIKVILLEKFSNKISAAIILTPLIFTVLLIIAIIIQLTLLSNTTIRKNQHLKETDKINEDLAYRMEEVNDEYVTKKIKRILNQNDLYVYTNSLWKYNITANDIALDDMEINVKAKDSSVVILLTEKKLENPLPDEIINIGSVTRGDKQDKIQRHISVGTGEKENTITPDATQNETENIYKFTVKNVKAGDKVIVEISDQLGAKLNTPFNRIIVNVS